MTGEVVKGMILESDEWQTIFGDKEKWGIAVAAMEKHFGSDKTRKALEILVPEEKPAAVKVPAEQTLAEYLGSGWIENVEAGSIEELTLGGLPAATAAARGDQWAFRLYVVRFNNEVYRFIFAAKARTPEIEKAFRDSVATFRRLTQTEAKQAKPLRIKIITVKAGDTVEGLSRRMALIDRQAERFRVLNGLEPGERLKTGEQVKIIVE